MPTAGTFGMGAMKLLNVYDYREAAKKRLPRGMFEFIDRGTEDEVLLSEIRKALNAMKLDQYVLNDVSRPDTSVVVFGETLSMPVIVAPTGVAGMVWHDGDVQIARAAKTHGIPFCIATMSMASMEEIADGAKGANLWYQLYVLEDRGVMHDMLQRARNLGIKNLLLTADTPRSPKKEWNTRNGFGMPIVPTLRGGLDVLAHPKWLVGVLLRHFLNKGGLPTYANYPLEYRTKATRAAVSDKLGLARRLTWEDAREIRRHWDGNLIIKGVMQKADAEKSAALGADGIVVSCHGGRNYDSSPTSINVLPEIADAVGGRLTVLADSGVRRGADVVKYMDSGAKAVLIGRATLYGAAVSGEHGAEEVLKFLRDEIDHCMAFTGRESFADSRSPIRPMPR